MTPKGAVVAAARELPSSPFVNLVAAEVLVNPFYRRAGAAKMFLQHLFNGQRRADFPYWYYPLKGVVNIWEGICKDKSERQDSSILELLRSAYWKILDVIWTDEHFLFESYDSMAAEWRATVSLFFKYHLRDQRCEECVVNSLFSPQ